MMTLQLALALITFVDHPLAAPGVTSLTNPEVEFTVETEHFAVLTRGPLRAVVVDNAAIDNDTLPNHRAGYSGVAALSHTRQPENLFVPGIAGLNFEHIHDGTLAVDRERFEPRRASMELRRVSDHVVELYQPPTPNWALESCGRYELLQDAVEYTFECRATKKLFSQNYIGLFWASYIHQPEDKAIFFQGWKGDSKEPATWIRALSPKHGVDSTHRPKSFIGDVPVHKDFSLTLVNHPSELRYDQPWYYGVSHGMAFAQVFRSRDDIWFAQSPTGGGNRNPAWDFQWFVRNYRVGETYGFVMRAVYVPWSDRATLVKHVQSHLKALNSPTPQ